MATADFQRAREHGIYVSLCNTTCSVRLGISDHFSLQGGLAVGIPGELRGMEVAHNMFGR